MFKILKRFTSPSVLIVLLCLSFQMMYAFLDKAPDTDEAFYMQVARNIKKTGLPFESVQDKFLFLQHPPTFPYLVAFFFFLFGEGLLVGRLVSTVFSVALLILVYRIARQVSDKKISTLVTLVLAINPAFLYYSHSVYMEITLAFFNLLSVYLFLKAENSGDLKYFGLSGLFLGLSLITKYSSLILFALFIFYFLSRFGFKFLLKREVHIFLLPVIGGLLVWFIFGYALDKDEFFHQLRGWLQSSETSPYSWRAVSNFTYLKELIGVVTFGFLLMLLYGIFIWIKTNARKCIAVCLSIPHLRQRRIPARRMARLPIVGQAGGRLRRTFPLPQGERDNSPGKKFEPELLAFLPIYFLLYILFIFFMPIKDIKYIIPLLPVFSIFISTHIRFDFKLNLNLKGIVTALLLLILGFSLSPLSVMYDPTSGKFHENLWWFGIKRDYQYRAYKEIGLFLRTKLKPTDTFLCENKAAIIRYYADTRYVGVWGCPAEEIETDIPQASALVFEDDLPYISNQENENLREIASDQFRLEKSFRRKDGKHFWIYLRKDI